MLILKICLTHYDLTHDATYENIGSHTDPDLALCFAAVDLSCLRPE